MGVGPGIIRLYLINFLAIKIAPFFYDKFSPQCIGMRINIAQNRRAVKKKFLKEKGPGKTRALNYFISVD
jgi:hypothetical protein